MTPRASRRKGYSARLRLTISYAAFLLVAGLLLLGVVWAFLLRYVPTYAIMDGLEFFPGRNDLIRAFVPRAIWTLVGLLVVGLGGGWLLAGRMLAPLARMTHVTRQVSGGDLGTRISLEGPADEFGELSDAFDAMLDQLQAHVSEQERFAANASHELRTPLAVTQAMLDVARKDPQTDSRELTERLWTVNARAIELTEALLLLGRSGRRSFSREAVDLSLLVEDAVETLLSRAEASGVAIEIRGGVALAEGSQALLLQLTSNLVLNAIKHNLQEGGRIRITTWQDAGRAHMKVENTGALVPDEVVATLTEPFQRGDSRTRSDESGVGLGLAIVKSITQAHDGLLTLRALPRGGMRVSVDLPGAATGEEAHSVRGG